LPDTNILDIGFFSSLQSFQWTLEVLPSVEGLLDTMDRAFLEYPPNLLNRVWITHQTILDKIIAYRGDNSYKLPHIGKEALENELIFEPTILVSDEALQVLREDNIAQEMFGEIMNDLVIHDAPPIRASIARNRFIVDDVDDVDDVDESQAY
jgi:hypothetical protein